MQDPNAAAMRQLRHQNRHLRDQNQQLSANMEKLQDSNYVTAFALQNMQTLLNGYLGMNMEMLQMQAKAGHLVPMSNALPAQRELDHVSQPSKLTAAAQQRIKAEHRWQAQEHSRKMKALKLEQQLFAKKTTKSNTSFADCMQASQSRQDRDGVPFSN